MERLQLSARSSRACPVLSSLSPLDRFQPTSYVPSRGLDRGAPSGPNRRLVRSTWVTSKLPWFRIAMRILSAIRPVGVVIKSRQGIAARLEGNGICFPIRISGGERRSLGQPRPPPRRAEAGQELGPPAVPGRDRGVERVQRGGLYVKICWRHRRIPLALCLYKIECSTPRDSMGLASVREKCRSRHASQALLFFLCVAVRTVHVAASIDSGPAMRLPSWRVSARL
jgi:hypothetical protein